MKYFYLVVLVFFSIFIISKVAYSLEMKPVLSLELAKKMADACEARKETKDWNPINIAINKATSSAMIPRSTRKVGELAYGEDGGLGPRPGVATVDFLVPFAGGLPIRTDSGHLLGAIGVSGASSDQDEECAQAAIDAVRDLLK